MHGVFDILFVVQNAPGECLDLPPIGEKKLLHEFAFVRVFNAAGGQHGGQQMQPFLPNLFSASIIAHGRHAFQASVKTNAAHTPASKPSPLGEVYPGTRCVPNEFPLRETSLAGEEG